MGRFERVLLALWAWVLSGAPVAWAQGDVWASAQGLEGEALRAELHAIIDGHTVIPYDSSSVYDCHDGIDDLDQDPGELDSVLLLYSPFNAEMSSWPDYSREHVWPRSLGSAEGSPAYSDLHHILACDANVNSARGNKYFDECTQGCEVHPEAPDALFTTTLFEPPPEDKGDVARALFYMDVRYEGGAGEPDLVLTNGAVASGCNCMGKLDTLLAWHTQDPVDGRERSRHEGVFALQGNRNPFIDHPEWVCALWPTPDCAAVVGGGQVWINEIHYDNSGSDVGEGIEIAGTAGSSLAGWTLSLYDGGDSDVYGQLSLSGMIGDQRDGWGAVWVGIPGLQNGPVDGAALIDADGRVRELLSWEGTLKPTGGPAAGQTATPIAVSELSTTPAGQSLQRTAGAASSSWAGPLTASPGRLNEGQDLEPSGARPLWLSELHYDNAGADTGEGVEVGGTPGMSLAGYSVVLYNGADGAPYLTLNLSGTLPASGYLWVARSGIQNGVKDGAALLGPGGEVLEFLSYEGSLTARAGAAAGWTSRDIGVAETTESPVGSSLKREGGGTDDGPWVGPSPATPGQP